MVEISDEEFAQTFFSKLTKTGKLIQEFTKMAFGLTIGEVEDEFGIKWDIAIC